MQVERIEKFMADPGSDSFEGIALGAFAEAFEKDPTARQVAERHGLSRARIEDWRDIPAIPPPGPEAGLGSRTRGELRALAAEMVFRRSCLGDLGKPPILSLTGTNVESDARAADDADSAEREDSWVERFGGPGSLDATTSGRVDVTAARSWLAGRQRDGRAALVLATNTTLQRLLGTLERQDLRFQLATGSRVVIVPEPVQESGAPSNIGAPHQTPGAERLGLPVEAVIRQYRWRGVATACYGAVSEDGSVHLTAPPWLRFSYLEARSDIESRDLTALDLTSTSHPFRVGIDAVGCVSTDGTRITLSGA